MLVFSLYADLQRRGVELSLAENGRLRYRAPKGSLDEPLLALMLAHREDLAQLVFEIEEHKARVLEVYPKDAVIPFDDYAEAERLAHEAVRGAGASPDGLLYMRAYAMSHPTVTAYFEVFGELAGEIVEVKRAA